MGSRPHTEALIAWLEGDDLLAGRVFDGRVEGAAPQGYVLVFPHRPEHESSRMADRRRENRVRFTIHSVGVMPVQAEWFADRVQARLTGSPVRLTVAGEVQGIVEHESGDPMRVDNNAPPPVYFYADDYAWEATP